MNTLLRYSCLRLAGILGVCLLVFVSSAMAASNKGLDIYWPDVEGGGATLIVTPAGESVLIDTGNFGDRDAGRINKLAALAGLKKIDHVIITHFHDDHYGGAAELSKLIPIGHLYDNGIPNYKGNTSEYPHQAELDAYSAFKTDARSVMHAGDSIPLHSSDGAAKISLTCLKARLDYIKPHPNQSVNPLAAGAIKKESKDTENGNSIAMLLRFGPFEFFDGGDMTWPVEGRLVCPVNLVGKVDVYQVDHHGLDVSNNPVLIQSLAPSVTVMVNGPQKGCEPNTRKALREVQSIKANYQLHRKLAADADNTPDEFIANQKAECEGNYIKLSTTPDGKSYTISIPGTGHQKTYRTKP